MNIPNAKVGLTLGKFAPLHAGHQLVLETALAEMDRVIAIIYDCPEVTEIPLPVRAGWIRRLYPAVELVEAWDGPLEVGDTPAIKRMHENYVIERLGIRGVTHFYSSEFYGEHMSRALGAADRRVDEARERAPISGTAIRQDPYRHRRFLNPVVYRDLVANVGFVGAPSTGKTTIAQRMAEEYRKVWMPEYGREYWEQHQVERRLSLEQLVEIAEGHLEREERLLLDANRYLFTDTNAITTYMFSLYYHGAALDRLRDLALQSAARYDLVFLCDADIPYDDTWDRSGDVNRQVFQRQIVADLLARKIPFFVLRGGLDERAGQVRSILDRYTKYRNLADLFRL
jgi:NadR type nicotinamide-nucleotide adenylyltransferase